MFGPMVRTPIAMSISNPKVNSISKQIIKPILRESTQFRQVKPGSSWRIMDSAQGLLTEPTAILGLMALYLVMPANAQWDDAAAARIIEGLTGDRSRIQAVCRTGCQAIEVYHQRLPLLAVGLDPAIEAIGDQVADLMGHHLVDKLLWILLEQYWIKPELVELQMGGTGALAPEFEVDLGAGEAASKLLLGSLIARLDGGDDALLMGIEIGFDDF